jgi:hypothetical protein
VLTPFHFASSNVVVASGVGVTGVLATAFAAALIIASGALGFHRHRRRSAADPPSNPRTGGSDQGRSE